MSLNIRLIAILIAGFSFLKAYTQSVETVVQTGHYGPVTAVCYSNDGRFIATGSDDKTVKLWRRADGREIRTFQGNISGISLVEINRQGIDILSPRRNSNYHRKQEIIYLCMGHNFRNKSIRYKSGTS